MAISTTPPAKSQAKTALSAYTSILLGKTRRADAIHLSHSGAQILLDDNGQRPLFDIRRKIQELVDLAPLTPREKALLSLKHGLDLFVLPVISQGEESIESALPYVVQLKGRPSEGANARQRTRAIRYQLEIAYRKIDRLLVDQASPARIVQLQPESDFVSAATIPLIPAAILSARRVGEGFPKTQASIWLNIDWWLWHNAERIKYPAPKRRPSQRINQERLAFAHALVSVFVYMRHSQTAHQQSVPLQPERLTFFTSINSQDLIAIVSNTNSRRRISEILEILERQMHQGPLDEVVASLLDADYETLLATRDYDLALRAAVVMTRAGADLPNLRHAAFKWFNAMKSYATPNALEEMALNISVAFSGEGRYLEAEVILQQTGLRLREKQTGLLHIGLSAWRRRALTDYLHPLRIKHMSGTIMRDCMIHAMNAVSLTDNPQNPSYARSIIRLAEGTSILHVMQRQGHADPLLRGGMTDFLQKVDDGISKLGRWSEEKELTPFDSGRLLVIQRAREAIDSDSPRIDFKVKEAVSKMSKDSKG